MIASILALRPGVRPSMKSAALAALAVLGLVASSLAREFEFTPIEKRLVDRMPKPAKDAYERTVKAIDQINYDVAYEASGEAAKADPESVELRFLAIKLARYRGESTPSGEATKYFDAAIEHAKGLMAINSLSARQKAQVQYMLDRLETQRKTVEERDASRRTYGLQIAKAYAKQVYSKSDDSAEIKAYKAAMKALGDANKGTTGSKAAAKILKEAVGGAAEGAGAGGERKPLAADSEQFKAAKAFLDEKAQKFFASWDFNDIKDSVAPEMINGAPGGDNNAKTKAIADMFQLGKVMLGPMKDYKNSGGEAVSIKSADGETIEAKFELDLNFEKGPNKVHAAVVQRGGTWLIKELKPDVDPTKIPAGMDLGKLMKK